MKEYTFEDYKEYLKYQFYTYFDILSEFNFGKE